MPGGYRGVTLGSSISRTCRAQFARTGPSANVWDGEATFLPRRFAEDSVGTPRGHSEDGMSACPPRGRETPTDGIEDQA